MMTARTIRRSAYVLNHTLAVFCHYICGIAVRLLPRKVGQHLYFSNISCSFKLLYSSQYRLNLRYKAEGLHPYIFCDGEQSVDDHWFEDLLRYVQQVIRCLISFGEQQQLFHLSGKLLPAKQLCLVLMNMSGLFWLAALYWAHHLVCFIALTQLPTYVSL